jgi:hypothetical protein
MNQALSPFLVLRALLPNTMQWQGPDPSGAVAAPSATGTNYIFTATQFVLKNYETSKYYLLQVTWPAGQEELMYVTEVVTPVAAGAIPNSGANFEFTTDGYLRFKHELNATFHNLFTWNGLQTTVGAGVASSAGTFAAGGNNYRIVNSTLQILDAANGNYYTPWLVGGDGFQQLELQ